MDLFNPSIGGKSAAFPLLDITMTHPALTEAQKNIRQCIKAADDSPIIGVVGATSVGKTHLINNVIEDLFESEHVRMKAESNYLPVAAFRVRSLSDQGFNWTGFYEDYLRALEHPAPKSSDINVARGKIQSAHQSRGTVLVFIDEAQHIILGAKPEMIQKRSEVIKSLSQETGAKLVLIGTYALLPLLGADGQTIRRNELVHFRRYRYTKKDRSEFTAMLALLERDFPSLVGNCLLQHEEEVYEGCLGLIGLLKSWLARSFVESEGKTITWSHMLAKRPDDTKLSVILDEAHDGERLLAQTPARRAALRERIKQDWSGSGAKTTRPSTGKEKKVQRKAHRDRTGSRDR